MNETKIIDDFSELVSMEREPFLLHGYVDKDHKTVTQNMIATRVLCPEITISLNNKSTKLMNGYNIADYNIKLEESGNIIEGIKPGGDVTIYAVNYQDDSFIGIKGYELYPGNPKQYIEFLKSPFNAYMLYVRLFIGVALLLFVVSIVLNIKK